MASQKLDFGFLVKYLGLLWQQGEAKSRGRETESVHSDGAGGSGRHMKEYYCFFCILMTEPEDETAETGGGDEGGLESSRGDQV